MKFVTDKPALAIGKYLIISDLHVGLKKKRKDIPISLDIEEAMEKEILDIKESTGTDKIVLLGDVKDDITSVSPEVYDFFGFLKSNFKEVIVAKGNHDGDIEVIPGIKVHPPSGFVLKHGRKKYGLLHGHSWPDEKLFSADYIITGHQHRYRKLVDKQGKMYFQKVWIITDKIAEAAKAKYRSYRGFNSNVRCLILPSFNPLIMGEEISKKNIMGMGPLFTEDFFGLKTASVYSLSGVCFGKVKELV